MSLSMDVIAQLNAVNEELTKANAELKARTAQLEMSARFKDDRIERYQATINEQETVIARLQKRNVTLNSDNEALQKAQDSKSWAAEAHRQAAKAEELTQEVSLLKTKNMLQAKTILEKGERIATLTNHAKELNKRIRELTDDNEELDRMVMEGAKEVGTFQANNMLQAKRIKELEGIIKKADHLAEHYHQLQRRIDRMKGSLEEHHNYVDHLLGRISASL